MSVGNHDLCFHTVATMERTSRMLSLNSIGVTLILAFLALGGVPLQAQTPVLDSTSTGRLYVVAFPDTSSNITDPRFQNTMYDTVALFIYSSVANDVTITSPDGYSNHITPEAGKFQIVYLNYIGNRAPNPITTLSGKATNTTFRVNAKFPIILYCWMSTSFGGEAWTPIPVERWGKEYVAAAIEGSVVIDMTQDASLRFIKKRRAAPAEIVIVAAYDNTHVTIAPNSQLQGSPPLYITLNRDQVYQVQSRVDTAIGQTGLPQDDIGGSRITADRPIGVLSGNTRQMAGLETSTITNNAFKNMMIEWLAPVEQMGREFLFMPTFDNQRLTGQAGEKVADKRQFEYIRVYGASPGTTRIFYQYDSTRVDTFTVSEGGVREIRIDRPFPHRVRTDKPAQAMMHSSGVVKYNGTIGTVGQGGATYDAWGPYMVELTPREQWVHTACFHVPLQPAGFQNYINIVADTFALDKIFDELNIPLDFSLGPIPGTDLMWVAYPISSGVDHYLRSIDTTKFFAFVYGVRKGTEQYIPHRTLRKDEGSELQSMAASDYIETVGLSFGYPTNPQRRMLARMDSLVIDSTTDCSDLTVTVRAVNAHAVGLESITLADTGRLNAQILWVTPNAPNDLIGRNQATFKVVPLDRSQKAMATVVISDRTGASRQFDYNYRPERIGVAPDGRLEFGVVEHGSCRDTIVTITNPTSTPVKINGTTFLLGNRGLSVVSTDPSPLPLTLIPGGTLRLRIRFCPDSGAGPYIDTLQIGLGCTTTKITVGGLEAIPCLYVDDLRFGTLFLNTGTSKTLPLEVCNTGDDTIHFINPADSDVLTWGDKHFSVPASTIDSLKRFVALGPGECTTIQVTFTPTERGTFRTVAKFWSTAGCLRDTSIWTALVDSITSSVDVAAKGYANLQSNPNPAAEVTEISFRLGRSGETRLVAYDLMGREIATLVDGYLSEGKHRIVWDTSKLPTGVYHLRLVSGEFRSTLEILVTR